MQRTLVINADQDNRFDLSNNTIYLKVPVPIIGKKHYFKDAYSLSNIKNKKAIVVHITNDTKDTICGYESTDFLNIEIPFSKVRFNLFPNDSLILDENENLTVYIVNDITEDFVKNFWKIKIKLAMLFFRGTHKWGCNSFYLEKSKSLIETKANPEEAGGGVIIKNP